MASFISGTANNTFVYDNLSNCNTAAGKCETLIGGAFTEGDSNSWESADADTVGAAAETDVDTSSYIWGHDRFYINSSFYLDEFPIGIPKTYDWPTNTIGLGNNSTLLSAFLYANATASRSWGLFWGKSGANEADQMNGTLVIGGYDSAKIAAGNDANYTASLQYSSYCPTGMVVSIDNVIIDLEDNHPDILSSNPMNFCIRPDYTAFALNYASYLNFYNYTGQNTRRKATGLITEGRVVPSKDVYSGRMTFTVGAATPFNISILNTDFVVPAITVKSDGTQVIANSSESQVLIEQRSEANVNVDADGEIYPILGHPFLANAYLLVDHDTGTFTVFKSNPSSAENLVTIVSDDSKRACPVSGSSAANVSVVQGSGSESDSSSSSDNSSDKSSSSTNVGAIVGGTIGGVAAVGLAIAAVFFLRRRRSRKLRSTEPEVSQSTQAFSELPDASVKAKEPYRGSTGSNIVEPAPVELPATAVAEKPTERYG